MLLFDLQRAALALCFLCLIGCSTPCREWDFQEIKTKIPCFNGGRLLLASELPSSPLELELARNRSGIRFYVNLSSMQARPLEEDPSRTQLEIVFEEQDSWTVYPYLLSGGQRMLLPGDIADALVEAIINEQSFTIRMGRHQLLVIPANFIALYQKLIDLDIEEDVTEEE